MAIPKFYGQWLRAKRLRGVLRRGLPPQIASFCLDLNGLIHACAQIVYAYGNGYDPERARLLKTANPAIIEVEFHNYLGMMLSKLLTEVQPQKELVIAVDGVAPRAKIQQQRQRRFRAALESTGGGVFDSNGITPGTEFMQRLDNFIQRWLQINSSTLPPKVIYSSHLSPGEGEHKIYELLRKGEISPGPCVVYGMDADLIMLSLAEEKIPIFLMREDITDVVDIENLKVALREIMGNVETALDDFILIMSLIGNDFLPHSPAFEDMADSIDFMLKVYAQMKRPLTRFSEGRADILWENFGAYIIAVAQQESVILAELAQKAFKYPSRMLEAAIVQVPVPLIAETAVAPKRQFSYDLFRGAWYSNAFLPRGTPELRAVLQKFLPAPNITPEQIVSMATNYMTGLAWVYVYYKEGMTRMSEDYTYNYFHTPLLTDLAGVVAMRPQLGNFRVQPSDLQVGPLQQLLAVLPRKSQELLPVELQGFMDWNSPIIDIYPEAFIVERDGKDMDWQGVAILPQADFDRIFQVVAMVDWKSSRLALFEPVPDIVIVRNQEQEALERQREKIRAQLAQMMAPRGRGFGRGERGRGRGGFERGRGRGGFERGRGRGRGRGGFERGRGRGRGRQEENRLAPPQPLQPVTAAQRTFATPAGMPTQQVAPPQGGPDITRAKVLFL
jgi:5'-3' exonuclease